MQHGSTNNLLHQKADIFAANRKQLQKNPLNGGLIKFVPLLLAADPAQLR
ncbi:hypothetical protein ACNJKD_10205 [Edwardsiella tarda]